MTRTGDLGNDLRDNLRTMDLERFLDVGHIIVLSCLSLSVCITKYISPYILASPSA